MSETITLGKSRKSGEWKLLVQPERPFGEHLDAYRKLAANHPVNDEFSRVVIGKLNHSSPALVLVTTEQAGDKAKADVARIQSVTEIVKTAGGRQQQMEKEAAELKAMEHEDAIAEKNIIINQVRKDTNQQPIKLKTKPAPAKEEKPEA